LIIGKNDSSMTLMGLSNLDSIGGSLSVSGTLASFIGLENVQTIGNDLFLGITPVSDFTGLDNLNSIGGNFEVSYVTNFTGLENLNVIEGDFNVWSELSSFQGLNNLTSIGGDFFIGEIQGFEDFSGLENLTTIGGGFGITGEDTNITSFTGLENLTTIGGNFDIYECHALSGFSDLEKLNTIGGSLILEISSFAEGLNFPILSTIGSGIYIRKCSGLNNLNGLESLTSFGNSSTPPTFSAPIAGEIRLKNNLSLTDISAISHLSIDTLSVTGNTDLSVCGIESICTYLEQGGIATIANNAEMLKVVIPLRKLSRVVCPSLIILLRAMSLRTPMPTVYRMLTNPV